MKNKNLESVFSTIIFSLLNVVYLLFHFSKWGCIPLALTVIYYFICINQKGKEKYTVTDWLGSYIGALCVDMMLIKACFYGVIPSKPTLPSSGVLTGAIFILIAEVIILININKKGSSKKYGVSVFFKYLILIGATLGCSYLFIKWNEASVLFALLFVTMISLILELFVHRYNEKSSTTVFIWTMILFVLFNVMNCLYGEFSIAMVNWVMNISFEIELTWYKGIIILLFALAGIVETIALRKNNISKFSDTKVYTLLLGTGVFSWILASIKTKYNFIFIILFVLANIVFLNINFKDKELTLHEIKISRVNLLYLLVLAITIGLSITFYNGSILPYVSLIVVLLYVVLKCCKGADDKSTDDKKPYYSWSFWQTIITFLSVYAIIVASLKCRTVRAYILIGIVYCATTLAFYIISLQNQLQYKNHYVMRIFIAIPTICILLFAVNQSDIKTNYKIDNVISSSENLSAEKVDESGNIALTIYSKSKDSDIEKAYCYWLSEKDNTIKLQIGKDDSNTIQIKNDCLCVVCEDKSGLIYTDRHWFFENSNNQVTSAGTLRYYEVPTETQDELPVETQEDAAQEG